MKKTVLSILLTAALLVSLVGCTSGGDNPDTTGASSQGGKIGFITGTGGLGDKNLNDSTYSGAQLAEADGVQVDVVEPKENSDLPNLQEIFAETGEYDAIFCIASEQADALAETADKYPDQKFVLADTFLGKDNVTSLVFRAEETGFQLGALAGLLAKDGSLENSQNKNKIGFIGGMDIPVINMFAAGYVAGAKLANPDVEVEIAYVGGFSDPSKATELANGLYEKGVDVIFACAGGSGLGVFTAAEKMGGYALGIETNQNGIAPNHIVASGVRLWEVAVYDIINKAIDGTLEGGLSSFGIKEEAIKVDYDDSQVEVSDTIKDEVQRLCGLVADGSLALPDTLDGVESFLDANK